MKLPSFTHARSFPVSTSTSLESGEPPKDNGVEPQACCLETCTRVLGHRVCSCALEADVCP